jgi:hypothetical protein
MATERDFPGGPMMAVESGGVWFAIGPPEADDG